MKKARNFNRLLPWAAVLLSLVYSTLFAQDLTVFSSGPYKITRRTTNGEWVYTLRDTAMGSLIEIWQRGARLDKFAATVNGIQYDLLWAGGNNWKMMPWPNRTANGRFTDEKGTTYDLLASGNTENDGVGNAIHGVVKNKMYTDEKYGLDDDGVYILCSYDTYGNSAINNIFGRFKDFSMYHLKGNVLIIDGYVTNLGTDVFENCGWGWHPQYNAPFKPVNSAQLSTKARCWFKMPADSVATVNSKMIPNGMAYVGTFLSGQLDFRPGKQFAGIFIDHYFTALKPEPGLRDQKGSEYVRMALIDRGNKVRVQYFGEYPIQPWITIHTTTTEPFLNPEYQTMEVNGLNTKRNLIRVLPDSTSPKARIYVCADNDTTFDTYTPPFTTTKAAVWSSRIQNRGFRVDKTCRGLMIRFESPQDYIIEMYDIKGRIAAKTSGWGADAVVKTNATGTYVIKVRGTTSEMARAVVVAE